LLFFGIGLQQAAHVVYSGTGLILSLKDLNAESLRVLVDRVLTTPAFRERARCIQPAIEKTRGLDLAAILIEDAFSVS
jgi:zeaxanthin glucosyltransferase